MEPPTLLHCTYTHTLEWDLTKLPINWSAVQSYEICNGTLFINYSEGYQEEYKGFYDDFEDILENDDPTDIQFYDKNRDCIDGESFTEMLELEQERIEQEMADDPDYIEKYVETDEDAFDPTEEIEQLAEEHYMYLAEVARAK